MNLNLSKGKKVIILAIIIILSIAFLFQNKIFRGELIINLEAPYEYTIDNHSYQCHTTPCNIKIKSGKYSINIVKDDYYPSSQNIDIPLWKRVEINPELDLLAQLFHTEELLYNEQYDYQLLVDKNEMQKLVDQNKNAIVFFPKNISPKQILNGRNFSLIIEEGQAYKINLESNSKQKIDLNFPEINEFKWSINGDYLAYQTTEDELYLVNFIDQTVDKIDLQTNIDTLGWINQERLIFATNQKYEKDLYSEENGYLMKPENTTTQTVHFLIYNPRNKEVFSIGQFSEITDLPSYLNSTNSGNEIYFQHKEENFKIILEKI